MFERSAFLDLGSWRLSWRVPLWLHYQSLFGFLQVLADQPQGAAGGLDAADFQLLNNHAALTAVLLGNQLRDEGHGPAAIAFYRRAIERHGKSDYGNLLRLELGTTLRDENQLGAALHELRLADAAFDELLEDLQRMVEEEGLDPAHMEGFVSQRSLCLSELGAVHDRLGMSESALACFEQAEALALESGEWYGPDTRANVLFARLNYAVNRWLFDEGRAIQARLADHPWSSEMNPALRLSLEQQLAMLAVGEAFTKSQGDDQLERRLRELLTRDQLKLDDRQRLRVYLATYLLDRERVEDAELALGDALDKLQREQGFEGLRLQAIGVRARLLRKQGPASQPARQDFLMRVFRPAMQACFERLAEGPLEASGVGLLSGDFMQEVLSEFLQAEIDCGEGERGIERALECVSRLQSLGTYARQNQLPAVSLEEVRSTLMPKAGGILLFVPGRESGHLFALDAERLRHLRLPAFHHIARSTQGLRQAISACLHDPGTRSTQQLERAVHEVREHLLPRELEATLQRWDEVCAVSFDALGFVSLEVLEDHSQRSSQAREPADAPQERAARAERTAPQSTQQVASDPLPERPQTSPSSELVAGQPTDLPAASRQPAKLKRHAISYQPSLPVGVHLTRRARAQPPRQGPLQVLLGSGVPNPEAHPNLQPITLATPEKSLGLSGLPIETSLLEAATRQELEDALVQARLATLVAHGTYDPTRVRPAGVLLQPAAEADTWHAEDFERLAGLPPVVVVACGTERALWRLGDDGNGRLRSALFKAGSACVATSNMDLELRASAEFMGHVHRALGQGASLSQAFLVARRDARPEHLGVDPVHSSLLNLWGYAGLRIAEPSGWEPAAELDEVSAQVSSKLACFALGAACIALVVLGRKRMAA